MERKKEIIEIHINVMGLNEVFKEVINAVINYVPSYKIKHIKIDDVKIESNKITITIDSPINPMREVK